MNWSVGPYELRGPQQRAVEGLRAECARLIHERLPVRVILQGVCGFGKTVVSSYLTQEAVAKGKRVMFIAHGRVLIYQKSDKLAECEIRHSVMMADCKDIVEPYAKAWTPESQAAITVVSKDTYESLILKGAVDPLDFDLVIVDEAHDAMSESWRKMLKRYRVVIGLTGTPALGTGRGLGAFYNGMVIGAAHGELVDLGWLVPCRYFDPWSADTRGLAVNTQSGEYVQDAMGARFLPLVGDFVEEWHRIMDVLGERRTTAFYASSVAHSEAQAQQFREGDGTLTCPRLTWEHVDADTPQSERRSMYRAMMRGDVDGISNYGVLRVGWDCPRVSCIQLGVTMRSLVQFLQTVGRGFRPFSGKSDCAVIDHGAHLRMHGWPQDDRSWALDERESIENLSKKPGERPTERTCYKCGRARPVTVKLCPQCGEDKARQKDTVKTEAGRLEEVDPPEPKPVRIVCEGQRLWDSLVFPSFNSRSPRCRTMNALKSEFERRYPRFRVDSETRQTKQGDRDFTVIRDTSTGDSFILGNAPEPHSPYWDYQANKVKRGGDRKLQFAEQLAETPKPE